MARSALRGIALRSSRLRILSSKLLGKVRKFKFIALMGWYTLREDVGYEMRSSDGYVSILGLAGRMIRCNNVNRIDLI